MIAGDRKNRILVVTTGGTICSTEGADGLNDVNSSGTVPVLVNLTRAELTDLDDIEYDTISPIDTLSENMTVEYWNKLLDALRTIDYSLYDGVIILHGSDTLHMISPLMSFMMRGLGLPIVLVAANRILTDPESNGVNNMCHAVRFIQHSESGVYVIYRNSDGITYLHDALELEECPNYSEDFFSKNMRDISKVDESEISEMPSNAEPLLYKNIRLTNSILYIKPYVGINYSRFMLDGVKAVLHGLYHSSTARSECLIDGDSSSVISLIDRCKESGISFYIHPCDKESMRYSSIVPMLEHGAKPLSGLTWNATYIWLMIKYSE